MKILNKILAVLGIVLFVLVLNKFGFARVFANLSSLKFYFLVVLIPSTCMLILYSSAWFKILNHYVSKNNFLDILKIKLIGEAFNYLTPLGFVGGDPIRFLRLKDKVPKIHTASSLVLDRTIYLFSGLVMIFNASLILVLRYDLLPSYLEFIVPSAIILVMLVFILMIFKDKEGFFRKIKKLILKINIKADFFIRLIDKLESVNEHIAKFFETKKKEFFQVLTINIIGRVCGVLEIWVIMIVIGLGSRLEFAFLMGGITNLLVFIFYLIPGQIGFVEGSYGVIFGLVGLDPTVGVSVQIIRRLRAFLWITLGLILINFEKKGKSAKDLVRITENQ